MKLNAVRSILPLILDPEMGLSRVIRDSFAFATSTSTAAREEIFRRAHAIWESEGCPDDRQLDHWLQAESEFLGQT
jgi:hypothetical protein